MKPVALLLLASGLAASCSREREPEAQAQASAKPAPEPVRPRVPLRAPLRERIVAIGDLHGDIAATYAALQIGGAIDASHHWSGGSLNVVQTGDQLDRGDDDRKITDYLYELANEAKAAGGAVHVLNGNHELMNAAGDFRYVTPGGFRAFAELERGEDPSRPALNEFSGLERGRAMAFLAGGPYAKKLAEHSTILVLGDSVFVHGGVAPEHVRYGVDRINNDVSRFLRGDARALPPILQRDDSPVWTRAYSNEPLAPGVCQRLGQVLDELGARRMVVGHTVQIRGITSACEKRVWRIDVGLSSYYGGPRQVLEIKDSSVKILGRALSAPL